MKNILAENMLRFRIKNLTESAVEKIQGLTEQSAKTDISHMKYYCIYPNIQFFLLSDIYI
jgi:hypothetical protein